MTFRNKAVAETDADAVALAGWENPWPSLVWSDAQGKGDCFFYAQYRVIACSLGFVFIKPPSTMLCGLLG